MDLIRKLDMRPIGTQFKRWGLFYCPKCKNNIETRYQHGIKQKSCGCEKHGFSRTPIYKLWSSIKKRCYNVNEENYERYGGRNISMCDEWKNNFMSFKNWVDNNNYKKGLQIDRKDNDGNYEPSNCRFITQLENSRNKRNLVLSIEKARQIRNLYSLGEHTYSNIGKIFGIDPSLIRQIILNKIWKERGKLEDNR